jgi:monothiol glutaredoxin
LANQDIRQQLPEYSGWGTFPQIFVDGKLVGGCDVAYELYESGELQKLLGV